MPRTDRQLLIEAQHGGKDLKRVLLEVLERHRGSKYLTMRVGLDLNISDQTVVNWCRDLEINLSDYQ